MDSPVTAEGSRRDRQPPFVILSLGAGVQSSALALMAARGEIGPMPQAAIFADTQGEPDGVYRWLDWLTAQLPYPVIRVTAGNLAEKSLQVRTSESGNKYTKSAVPAFIVDREGKKGILMRQCTLDSKITVLIREIARLRKLAGKPHVTQWIGISVDESKRRKPSRVGYITNSWPLVDARLSRQDCLAWMAQNGFPTPPRSSCVYCPFHSDAEWRRMKETDPASFAAAVNYDERLRMTMAGILRGTPFLHSSLQPLAEIDFSRGPDQPDLFGSECEGMCGV